MTRFLNVYQRKEVEIKKGKKKVASTKDDEKAAKGKKQKQAKEEEKSTKLEVTKASVALRRSSRNPRIDESVVFEDLSYDEEEDDDE